MRTNRIRIKEVSLNVEKTAALPGRLLLCFEILTSEIDCATVRRDEKPEENDEGFED